MPTMKKVTPLLNVDAIEPVLPFWVDRLGFEKTAEVPAGDALGFAILQKDGVELMYQTVQSIRDDIGDVVSAPTGAGFLFIEVGDLDGVERALDGVPHVIPRRKTFYGADEIVVRDPAGNVVVFAQFS